MPAVVETQRLTKQFGALTAVRELDLTVQAGEIYGLLGPNGSGKTTLIRLLLGLLKPTSGRVAVLGRDMPDKGILSRMGYMTQSSALYEELTVRENVAFFATMCAGNGNYGGGRIDEVLALVELTGRAGSLVRTLSGGLKQRASLACALVHNPDLLLLDEPTVGIDPQLRATFWSYFRALAAEGRTLIISSHAMDEAERCDRLGLMHQGRLLAEGSAEQLRAQLGAPTLEEAFLQMVSAGGSLANAGEDP